MNKTILSIAFISFSMSAMAQAPAGYYTDTAGLTGYNLKTRLHNIIKNGHNDKGYQSLWNGYKTTDRDYYYENNGTLLDMYSEKPGGADAYEYILVTNQCGSYSAEGGCYNREHTIPQSLFNEASPMKNDIQFVVPTDGWVNGKRGNMPYGKVNNPNWVSTNGSKIGPNVSGGYSSNVFEPIDEFKGDFARIVFYFATRYQDRIPNFNQGNILDGTSTRSLQQWQVNLLLEWHLQDPVSQKEIDRNNAAFAYQGNRNPFIDHPQWVECIWAGQNCGSGTVDTSTNISNILFQHSIDVYPNPGTDWVNIKSVSNAQLKEASISSIDGRVLMHQSILSNNNAFQFSTQALANGMYFINIITDKGIIVKKYVKQ